MGEWLLSRRDRLIVARHEVPGRDRGPVPEGRSKSWSEICFVESSSCRFWKQPRAEPLLFGGKAAANLLIVLDGCV
jgi:hypothetical protein